MASLSTPHSPHSLTLRLPPVAARPSALAGTRLARAQAKFDAGAGALRADIEEALGLRRDLRMRAFAAFSIGGVVLDAAAATHHGGPGVIAAFAGAFVFLFGRRFVFDDVAGRAGHRRSDAVRDLCEAARDVEASYDAAHGALSPYHVGAPEGEFAMSSAAQECMHQRDRVDGLLHVAGAVHRVERERRRLREPGDVVLVAVVGLGLVAFAALAAGAIGAALVVVYGAFVAVCRGVLAGLLESRFLRATRALARGRPGRDLEEEWFADFSRARRRTEIELGRWLRTARDGPRLPR